MLIISIEIMRIIDEIGRCDRKCIVMRWSNSKVQLRQEKMLIISTRDHENNSWKRNAKKTKTEKNKRVTQATVKGWEINDFAERLN